MSGDWKPTRVPSPTVKGSTVRSKVGRHRTPCKAGEKIHKSTGKCVSPHTKLGREVSHNKEVYSNSMRRGGNKKKPVSAKKRSSRKKPASTKKRSSRKKHNSTKKRSGSKKRKSPKKSPPYHFPKIDEITTSTVCDMNGNCETNTHEEIIGRGPGRPPKGLYHPPMHKLGDTLHLREEDIITEKCTGDECHIKEQNIFISRDGSIQQEFITEEDIREY